MQEIYIQGENFTRNDIEEKQLLKGEYENCTFNNCNFSSTDFSGFKFINCKFNDCNLSLVKLNRTSLQDIKFTNCKLLGLRIDTCNEFSLSFYFDNCQLNHSSFYKTNSKKTVFKNSQLHETDFTNCDLTSAIFDNCDLKDATFDNTCIEKADFRTSYNYSIDLEKNRIKKAKFSISGITGLLDKYDISIESN